MQKKVMHVTEAWVLRLGDWTYWSEEGDKYYSTTRASDFIMQYMPVFAEATGDDRWMMLYETTYEIINSIIDEYSTEFCLTLLSRTAAEKSFLHLQTSLKAKTAVIIITIPAVHHGVSV